MWMNLFFTLRWFKAKHHVHVCSQRAFIFIQTMIKVLGMHLFSQLFTICPTVSPAALSSLSPTSIPPLVGDAAHQPPPHFDPVHHVRVIRGHASSGEPPQRHCLQLRPRADQRHGTTHTQIWSRALPAPAASNGSRVQSVKVDLCNQRSGFSPPSS